MTDKQANLQKKIGFILAFSGLIFTLFPRYQTSIPMTFGIKLIINILGVVFLIIGGRLYYRGRQHAFKNLAEKMVSEDSENDILFLRPFSDDVTINKPVRGPEAMPGLKILQSTPEEDLYKAIAPIGKLTAIGKPGEKLPVPGALRVYADEDWQNVVIDKMKKSKMVIIQAGKGEGLSWELEQAFKTINLKKLMIFIFQMSKKEYEQFRKLVLQKVDIVLPEKIPFTKGAAYFSAGFFKFTDDKVPYFLALKAPALRASPYTPYYARFRYALKPLFEEEGIPWQKPPISKAYIFAFSLLGVLILFIALVAIFG